MKKLILSIYGLLIWMLFQLITIVFLTEKFLIDFTLTKFILFLFFALCISYSLVLVIAKFSLSIIPLCIIMSVVLLIIQVPSRMMIINTFNLLHLFLSNFLYSYLLVSSIHNENLI